MSRLQLDAQLRERWDSVSNAGTGKVDGAVLQRLAASRQTPHSHKHVAWLLDVLEQPSCSADAAEPALTLLARWARQQSMQQPQARQHELLARAAAAAQRLVAPDAAQAGRFGPQVAAACLLVLGSVAAAHPAVAEDAAEAVGTALLGGQLGTAQASSASDAAAAVASLLPTLLGKADAAGWLLGALLQWLSSSVLAGAAAPAALDCLAPAYSLMRTAATSALTREGPAAAIHGLLQPAYSVLKTATAAAWTMPAGAAKQPPTEPAAVAAAHAAAAVLGLAGLAEGLLRTASGYTEAAVLAAEAESGLVAACGAAAERVKAAGKQQPAQPEHAGAAVRQVTGQAEAAQLLCDACSLAAAQLAAAVRRPAATPGLARCQALSLLRSVLSLAPLCDAAAAQVPPAKASQQLRDQAGGALAHQAGTLARNLAEHLPLLPAREQQWVLQEVQVAALEAHRLYRRYSLETPAAWLAAVDSTALRQLLDRLFLSCLALLGAAWQTAPSHAQRAQRAQLAAAVLVALADLQFCRVASPQHAALLTAVLAEAPSDAVGAAAVAASLPCYAELAAKCRTRGGQPAWLVDGVTAAKVQLLMLALVPCVANLPQAALQQRLAPVAFLFLLHPHRPLAAAAHQLCCALLAAVEPEQQQLAAFYVRRCLEGCPGSTLKLLPEFGQGLGTILQALPVGSPTALLCLRLVLERWQELARRGEPSAADLAPLAAQQLLVIDHVLLREALDDFDHTLSQLRSTAGGHAPAAAAAGAASSAGPAAGLSPGAWPGGHKPYEALERELLAAVRGTDDCLRKPVLARWLLERHAAGSAAAGS